MNEKLGPCCACGKEDESVRNLILLDRRAPVPGSGWGCFVCGLPGDGAIALICDACATDDFDFAELATCCLGPTPAKKRIALTAFAELPFEHIPSKHEGIGL